MNLKIRFKNNTISLPNNGLTYILDENIIDKFLDFKKDDDFCIFLNDQDLSELSCDEKQEFKNLYFSYITKESLYIQELSVKDNLSLVDTQSRSNRERKLNLTRKITDFGLNKIKNKRVQNLCQEDKLKVALVRAVIKNPQVIIIDGKFMQYMKIFEMIQKVSKDCLVIIIGSDEGVANLYADYIIKDGEVVLDKNINKNIDISETGVKEVKLNFFSKLKIAFNNLFSSFKIVFVLLFAIGNLTWFGIIDSVYGFNREEVILDTIVQNDKYVNIYKIGEDETFTKNEVEEFQNEMNTHGVGDFSWDPLTFVIYNNLYNYDLASDTFREMNDINPLIVTDLLSIDSMDDLPSSFSLLAGELPLGKNEIMITDYQFTLFDYFGYCYQNNYMGPDKERNPIYFSEPKDIIGLPLYAYLPSDSAFDLPAVDYSLTISGVLDTGFDEQHFKDIYECGRMGEVVDSSLREEFMRKYCPEFQYLHDEFFSYSRTGYISPDVIDFYHERQCHYDLNHETPYSSIIVPINNRSQAVELLDKLDNSDSYYVYNYTLFNNIENLEYGQRNRWLSDTIFWSILLFILSATFSILFFKKASYKSISQNKYFYAMGTKSYGLSIFLIETIMFGLIIFLASSVISFGLSIPINSAIMDYYYFIPGIINVISFSFRQLGLIFVYSALFTIATSIFFFKKIKKEPIN